MSRYKSPYSIEQFRQAATEERIKIHLTDPHYYQLDDDELEIRDILRDVWTISENLFTKREQSEWIQQRYAITTSRAYDLIKMAERMFGDRLKVDAKIEAGFSRERFLRLAQMAQENNDFETARKCLVEADKALERLQKMDGNKPRVYAALIITDNPEALKPAQTLPDSIGQTIEFDDLPKPEAAPVFQERETL